MPRRATTLIYRRNNRRRHKKNLPSQRTRGGGRTHQPTNARSSYNTRAGPTSNSRPSLPQSKRVHPAASTINFMTNARVGNQNKNRVQGSSSNIMSNPTIRRMSAAKGRITGEQNKPGRRDVTPRETQRTADAERTKSTKEPPPNNHQKT